MTLFLRLLDVPVDEKAYALRTMIREHDSRRFEVAPAAFAKVPGSPFAYWINDRLRESFTSLGTVRERACAAVGIQTNDDFRFVRAAWEVVGAQSEQVHWPSLAKGGAFSPFYSDVFLCVNWAEDGHEIKAWVGGLYSHWSKRLQNVDLLGRPGLTWPLRTTSGLGVRVLPSGCIFAHKGPAAFVETDSTSELLALCAIMNSPPFAYLVAVQLAAADAAARSYEVGIIQTTPIPQLTLTDGPTLARLARRAWSLKRTLDTVNEISHAFLLPTALQARLSRFDSRAFVAELSELQSAIDDLAFRAYNFQGAERAAAETWALKPEHVNAADESEDDDAAGESRAEDTQVSLHSWVVGIAFGRFDIRLATGERQAPPEPEPFDPLPVRSPGMIPESDEAHFPARPLLVDDPGHALDLTAQIGDVLERVGFPPENPETLRRWLARDFFPLHIKMYSRSRRKAPIYWQLATPSATYSVWLYIHAFTRDSLFKVQNDYVSPKLVHEERQLESFRTEIGASPTAAERKELAARESFVEELRAFLDEVKRVAPLWNPVLDDGVILNFAPLWRLVPHHKPWQKELKASWDALCNEEYDWAHLAMHLWPERVIPKCATDRSLAIAHGLEEVFWLEGENGKWKPRPIPARSVEELVSERTSPAVKAALHSLLEAPAVSGGAGRGRPRRGRGVAGATT